MPVRRYRMMFSHHAYFGISDLRRITMATVFAADEILLPTHLHIDPLLDQDQRLFVQRRLSELHEIHAIRGWAIENSPDAYRRAPTEELLVLPPDNIVPTEVYLELLEAVEDQLVDYRRAFLPETANFEGITEFTLGKQTLCKFALAQELHVDRLLINRDSRDAFGLFLDDLGRYEQFEERILDQVVEGLNLPDISLLDMSDIERCRNLMPAFRESLLARTSGRFHELGLNELIAEISRSIIDEFTDMILGKMSDPHMVHILGRPVPLPAEAAKEAAWDILQLLVAPALAAKYMQLLVRWYRDSRELQPLLLLLKLHRIGNANAAAR